MEGEVRRNSPAPVIRPSEVAWPDPLATSLAHPKLPVDLQAITHLKQGLQDQFLSLGALMQRVEQLEKQAGGRHARPETDSMQQRIQELEAALAEKSAALKEARHQETMPQEGPVSQPAPSS